MALSPVLLKRFWAKVDYSSPIGCWPWVGAKNGDGYGLLYMPRGMGPRARLAHRLVWEQYLSPIPDGLKVLHHCDNPPCCRLDHLFLGTQADNVADMVAKHRIAHHSRNRGESHGMAKLTEETVYAIRAEVAAGTYHRIVAERFGVSRANVCIIANRKAWAWLPESLNN